MNNVQISSQVDAKALKAFLQVSQLPGKDCKNLLAKVILNVACTDNGVIPNCPTKMALFGEIDNTYSKKAIKGESMCISNKNEKFIERILEKKEELHKIEITYIAEIHKDEYWLITKNLSVENIMGLDDLCFPILFDGQLKVRYLLVGEDEMSEDKKGLISDRIEV